MGKGYLFEAVRTLEKEGEKGKKRSLQTEPTWEHKALSEPIQFFVLGASLSYGKPPEKGVYQPEERL